VHPPALLLHLVLVLNVEIVLLAPRGRHAVRRGLVLVVATGEQQSDCDDKGGGDTAHCDFVHVQRVLRRSDSRRNNATDADPILEASAMACISRLDAAFADLDRARGKGEHAYAGT
jgi:hypothetical protein